MPERIALCGQQGVADSGGTDEPARVHLALMAKRDRQAGRSRARNPCRYARVEGRPGWSFRRARTNVLLLCTDSVYALTIAICPIDWFADERAALWHMHRASILPACQDRRSRAVFRLILTLWLWHSHPRSSAQPGAAGREPPVAGS